MIAPVIINPNALYDDAAVVLTLGVPSATLARARRSRALRYTRLGRRSYYLGSWLLAWITDGEMHRASIKTGVAGTD